MKRSIPVFLLLLFFLSCSPLRHFSTDKLLIEMQKTACMGECPVYTLKISKNGEVLLVAEKHLPLEGTFRGSLGNDELYALRGRIGETGLYGMNNKYTSNFEDLPTTYLSYYGAGREPKRIIDYDGAPEALKELEMYLHQFIDDLSWKEIKTPAGDLR